MMLTKSLRAQVESTHFSERAVGGTGKASETIRVEDTVRVILVASQVITGNKVTRAFEIRHDSTSVTDFILAS